MSFYTNVFQRNGKIFVRGYDDNLEPFSNIITDYRPYIFIPDSNGDYKTIDGRPVTKKNFHNLRAIYDFLKQYKDVENAEYYGLTNFVYTYLNDTFPGKVQFHAEAISVVSIDIEVSSKNGFPDINKAEDEVTAITLVKRGKSITFGMKPFTPKNARSQYVQCDDEKDMLRRFLSVWSSSDWIPDVITGWSCIPLSSSIWTNNDIRNVGEVTTKNQLTNDNQITKIFPISQKEKYRTEFVDGRFLESSQDHKFKVRYFPKGKYTNLKLHNKKSTQEDWLSIKQINLLKTKNYVYCAFPLDCNKNTENKKYTNNQLYLAGLLYTDGTLSKKYGNRFYQADHEFITDIKENYEIATNILEYQSNQYSLRIASKKLQNARYLVFDGNNKKLNKKLLSTLSKSQFNHFIAGLLDGDGYYNHNAIGFCNYEQNNDAYNLLELLQWNGYYASIKEKKVVGTKSHMLNGKTIKHYKNGWSLRIREDIHHFPVRKKSRWGDKVFSSYHPKTSSNNIHHRHINGEVWVKVNNIINTHEIVDMLDISTSQHYFITQGAISHNCDLFDIPYLVHRITNLLGDAAVKRLSPFGFIEQREVIRAKGSNYKNFNDRKEVVYEIFGMTILDYLQLYKKFTFTNHESYALNAIAKFELKKEKIKYEGSLDDLYENDPQHYYEYNIEDAFLVDELEDKKNFIKFVTSLAYEAKINYIDGMVTLRPWDVIIHNYLLERGIVIPQYKHKQFRPIMGGYVKHDVSKMGLHKWVVSFDFEALYPTILTQHNISPETFVAKLPATDPEHIINRGLWPQIDSNYVYCANGTRYRRDIRGFIPEIVDVYKQKRKDVKDEMQRLKKTDKEKNAKQIAILDSQQQAIKVLNNGLYGALSMEYFRWYDANLAEAVTSTSQCCTRYVEQKLNVWMNKLLNTNGVDYIIAADTDSIYLEMEPLLIHFWGPIEEPPEKTVEMVDQICKNKIGPFIDKVCKEVCAKFNVVKPTLNMKREAICFDKDIQIETDKGRKKISTIKVGDMVLTHKGRYRKVVNTFRHEYSGNFVYLHYGRTHHEESIKATPNHPILVERNGQRLWRSFSEVVVGDIIFVLGKTCPKTNKLIPYWCKRHNTWNAAADNPTVRQKLLRGNRFRNRSGNHKHFTKDILPFCENMKQKGWQIIPVGSNVIPDAIGFKDGKIIAFEIEKSGGELLEYKKKKYHNAPINNFIDEVKWIDIRPPRKQNRSVWYEEAENGFVKVKIIKVETYKPKRKYVHNIEVEEDNTYIAAKVVVHNCEKVIWRAPKMYVMNVWDMEGVRNKAPELKVKGIEIVRSSTPLLCRTKLKEAISIIMNKTENDLQNYVESFRDEYNKLPFESIANPRTVDGIVKYSDPVTLCAKGTPFHVRGAIVYNHAIQTLGLEKKYRLIKDKDKIRFVYLKEPNPFNTHVIAAPDELPSEFKLEPFIDRQTQFEKTFLSPIESVTGLIGWRPIPINDLKAFL